MVSNEARSAAAKYVSAPNPQAYYNSLSVGRQRLVNAGLSAAGLVRVQPYTRPPQRQTTPQQTPQTQAPTPRAPRGRRQFVGTTSRTTTANTKANINGRLGRPLNFVGSLAQTYYLTITPVKDRFGNYQPFRSNIELRELLGKQHYPFFDRNKFYSVRVVVDFESGASKGGSIASQLYNNSTDLQNNILGLVITGFNNYGAIAQIEIEIIETTP